MNDPKFKIGQKVKFISDHDRQAGNVLSFSFHSANQTDTHTGWMYTVSSRYYDPALHDMIEGVIVCREEELKDMEYLDGVEKPKAPDKTVNITEKLNEK